MLNSSFSNQVIAIFILTETIPNVHCLRLNQRQKYRETQLVGNKSSIAKNALNYWTDKYEGKSTGKHRKPTRVVSV